MIKVWSEIEELLVDELEAYFCELEESNWILFQKLDGDPHRLEGYFESEAKARDGWKALQGIFGSLPDYNGVEEVKEQDWKNEYKKYLKPWSTRQLHWIPVWMREEIELPKGHVGLYLDAGMAFGTGAHETTQLCAERLVDYIEDKGGDVEGLSVIDAGCGSGILGISAELLGLKNTMGFDIDGDAVVVARENAEGNGVDMEYQVGGLEECMKPADFVMANILAPILMKYVKVLVGSVKPCGRLVLSGILTEECSEVEECFEAEAKGLWGSVEVDSRARGEWSDILLKRK